MAGYGLTETCPVASDARRKGTVDYADEADRYRRQSMAGWPIPGCEIRVVDAEHAGCPARQRKRRRSGDPRRQRDGRLLQRAASHRRGDVRRLVPHAATWPSGTRTATSTSSTARRTSSSAAAKTSRPSKSRRPSRRTTAVLETAWSRRPDPQVGRNSGGFRRAEAGRVLDEAELVEFLQQRLGEVQNPARVSFLVRAVAQDRHGQDSEARTARAILGRERKEGTRMMRKPPGFMCCYSRGGPGRRMAARTAVFTDQRGCGGAGATTLSEPSACASA